MQRKPGYPVTNCNIKLPDNVHNQAFTESTIIVEDESEQQKRRQQLINFGHTQWGFNNWSWSVTKQDLDFVDLINGKYSVGVAAFVSVTIKSFDIHRENVGYATSVAPMKGSAIYQARKSAVTNALRETLLSFGGSVATELLEALEPVKIEPPPPENNQNNQNVANRQQPVAPKNQQQRPLKETLPPAANRAPRGPPPRPNNEAAKQLPFPEGLTEEEARAERKRRQKQAQEEFRLKQMQKPPAQDENTGCQDLHKSSFDNLLIDIPTQDIVIEDSGITGQDGKRKSPEPNGRALKRRPSILNRLDIVTD